VSALAKKRSALLKKKGFYLGCPILAEFTVLPALMLRDRNILLRSTAVTPERKGSTRALVLPAGRTDRRLAPRVDRVKSAGVMKIHRPLPFFFG
jgi:hypothetical protein